MKRLHVFEFEDLPWFPSLIREYLTDYLNFTAHLSSTPFESLAQKLKPILEATQTTTLIDLCSGGGGPLPVVVRLLKEKEKYPVRAVLTDFYPNRTAFSRIQKSFPEITSLECPVDATQVPQNLKGFRTLFNGFHHFRPEKAKLILEDAARSRQGIAVYELVGRSAFGFLSLLILLCAMPFFTPFIRPFRFSRIIFTYFIPLVPLAALWDGFISCLRVYSPEELKKLTCSIESTHYEWEIGLLPFGKGPGFGTYLFGIPRGPLYPPQ